MPLQNRVSPYGTLFNTPARGTLMGNRGGAIHNDSRQIVRPYATRRWIACVLEFKGRWRAVMSPGRYTELFFLDEAVALAAGHRPCAECRRDRYNAFRRAWNPDHPPTADEMDAALHPARIDRQGKVTWQSPLDSLANGTFIDFDAAPWLVWNDALALWTPEGYTRRVARPTGGSVPVLTPQPIVACLHAGYEPMVHASLGCPPISKPEVKLRP
jgi:hypothetical protein